MFAICKGVVNLATQSPGLTLGYASAASVHYKYNNKRVAFTIIIILILLIIFYRDPLIKTGFPDHVIMGPCYGTIKDIEYDKELDIHRIIIFLSPFDVHTQTMPCNGYVTGMTYDPNGRFDLSYKVNKSRFNEKMTTIITSGWFGDVKVRQIAGKVVRRISNPNKVGKMVMCGEKLGMIKLSSRVDIEIPNVEGLSIDIKKDDYVWGSDTQLAHIETGVSAPGAFWYN